VTVFEGSRYENAAVIRTPGADGRSRPTLYVMAATGRFLGRYTQHVVQDGDRFDTLAASLWGDPELWWRIADINPEVVYPSDLQPGTVIRVPVA
jgi:nucleoid-associated protein YgaU